LSSLRLKNEATIKKIGATKSKSQNTGISNQNIIPKKIAPNTTAVPRSGCKMVKKSGIKVKMPATINVIGLSLLTFFLDKKLASIKIVASFANSDG